jgi:hypothetical protein
MSNVSFEQVTAILAGFEGTPPQKYLIWKDSYNFVIPPPPGFYSEEDLAHHIADNYTGEPIPIE